MRMRELGRTGISVSEICLGTMTWGQQNTQDEAFEQMDYALSRGINFFDTAEMYPVPPIPETQGKTEEYIGEWFRQSGKRKDIVLASKATGPGHVHVRDGKPLGRSAILNAIEGCLARLQTFIKFIGPIVRLTSLASWVTSIRQTTPSMSCTRF